MKQQKLAKLVMNAGGVTLAAYGVLLLKGLPEFSLGKFSAGAADTNGALLISLIGVALALFGWFSPAPGSSTGDSSADEP
jgi:hypothetical protein